MWRKEECQRDWGRGVDGEMGDVSGGKGRRRANTSLDKGVMVAGQRRGGC